MLAGCTVAASAQTKKYQIAAGLTAQVTHNPGAATIEVAMPGVELISLDLTQPATNTFLIKTIDYNFDGFKDFAFVSVNQTTGTQVYEIFLYHSADKSFEALEIPGGVCEQFGNVRLSAGDKTLRSSCKSGAKSSQDIYKWSGTYSLELLSSKDNSADAQQEMAEDKADKKADKAGQREDRRDQIKDKKDARKEAKEEEDGE